MTRSPQVIIEITWTPSAEDQQHKDALMQGGPYEVGLPTGESWTLQPEEWQETPNGEIVVTLRSTRPPPHGPDDSPFSLDLEAGATEFEKRAVGEAFRSIGFEPGDIGRYERRSLDDHPWVIMASASLAIFLKSFLEQAGHNAADALRDFTRRIFKARESSTSPKGQLVLVDEDSGLWVMIPTELPTEDRPAPGRVCVQAAPLGPLAQGPGSAGVGKKRLRVEALLGAAASPLPPPAACLVPDATLAEDLFPEDLPCLLHLLGRADLYLQDEVEVALHPTLTRVWSRSGRAGQRLVQAPGKNFKRYGFGLVDWCDGILDFELAEGRRAAPLCAQLRRAVARSRSRGRVAMVILDNLGIHTPKGSRLLRGLLAELGEDLVLVYTPTYDPDANRIEWLWRALRRSVTHTHQRKTLAELLDDADRWAHTITPAQVLSQIGSPFAPDQQPIISEALNHAA